MRSGGLAEQQSIPTEGIVHSRNMSSVISPRVSLSRRSMQGALVVAILFLLTGRAEATTQVFYVSVTTGSDSPAGGTLATPWKTIPYALLQVTGTSPDPVELRVDAGTYNSAITMEEFVSILGGYKPGFSSRDPRTFVSVLNGGGTATHVVLCANNATLDGFTVTGGNATGTGDNALGGGVFRDGTARVN